MRRLALAALVAVCCALLAGCGDDREPRSATQPTPTEPPATTEAPATTSDDSSTLALRLYFLEDGKLVATRRDVPHTVAVGRAALSALADGPTDAESTLGFTSACNSGELENATLQIAGGEATTEPRFDGACGAQVGWTLTQFPTVRQVNGAGRTDLERYVPQILVDSPAPFATVSSPLHVTGTANTFEATFEYDLNAGGRTIAHDFVTATSGTGTRGTFDISIPFEARAGAGELVVYESSAEDGSRINIRRIPLRLEPT